MLEALASSLSLVFSWPVIGYLLLGVVLGMWSGSVPGLGGIVALVVILPFTFGMEPVPAMALLLGLWAVTATSDTIVSVMLGIPGTTASQATIMDGYPLARMGQAERALGAAFTVSAFGGVVGALILAASLPVVSILIKSFGSPELFMLGVLGLTMVGTLSGKSIYKGLAAAALGLFISSIGLAEIIAVPRYTFDALYLMDGIPLIPAVLGLFAIPELLDLAVKDRSISYVTQEEAGPEGSLMAGVKDAFEHRWLAFRCSVLGTYIGLLPGLGASIVDWIAYGYAVQTAKDSSRFGKGDIRGVIAPEAANNAIKGGALIPTVAFGIPGSLGTAIVMGALIMQGLRPGPNMLNENLDVTFSLVWMLVVANVVAACLLMLWVKQVAKVAFLPGNLLVPAVISFVFMGAWLAGGTIGDWLVCFAMGCIGLAMKRGGWPRPPLVLALILGSILENSYQISVQAHGGVSWLYQRPIVLVIMAVIVVTIVLTVRRLKSAESEIRNVTTTADEEVETGPNLAEGEGQGGNLVLSVIISLLLIPIFTWGALTALSWPLEVRQFPLIVTIPGVVVMLIALFQDVGQLRAQRVAAGDGYAGLVLGNPELRRTLVFLGYIAGMLLLTMIFGQKIAIPVFIFFYLRNWGGYSRELCVVYSASSWLVIIIFYDRILGVLFHPSWLSMNIRDRLPDFLPGWLVF